MKNEDIILGIVKEDHKMLVDLNREVGEIKSSLDTRRREKAKGFTLVGLFISAGVLIGKAVDTVISLVV